MCKQWYRIIKDTHAWPVINFYEKGPIKENGTTYKSCFLSNEGTELIHIVEYKEKCQFPKEENDVFYFLTLFAGAALREVYLPVFSTRITNILCQNCPNIQVLCFLHGYPILANITINVHNIEEILNFPPKLRSLTFQTSPILDKSIIAFDDEEYKQKTDKKILHLLSKCGDLQHLTLYRHTLTAEGMKTLAEKTDLRELELLQCLAYNSAGMADDLSDYPENSHDSDTLLDELLTSSLASLKAMTCFRLVGHLNKCGHSSNCDRMKNLLDCIGQWKHLKCLALKRVNYSSEAFEEMAKGLSALESLELEGSSLTSDIVSTVGIHLQSVKFLDLRNGEYSTYSLQALLFHPKLKRLWIIFDPPLSKYFAEPMFYSSLYDVLVSLPEIQHVKLRDYKISIAISATYFRINKDIVIEVQNNADSRWVKDSYDRDLRIDLDVM